MTVALLVAIILQSLYLPHSYSGCQDAETWQNASGNSNFFQVASNLSDFATTPQDVCDQFVQIWAIGLAIV
jgi:hypothetical protein